MNRIMGSNGLFCDFGRNYFAFLALSLWRYNTISDPNPIHNTLVEQLSGLKQHSQVFQVSIDCSVLGMKK